MIREIMRGETFLAQKAELATPEDLPVVQDLLDTLEANKERCVGMAANMIGVNKRIIVFDNEGIWQCSTRRLSSVPTPIRRKKDACPLRAPVR